MPEDFPAWDPASPYGEAFARNEGLRPAPAPEPPAAAPPQPAPEAPAEPEGMTDDEFFRELEGGDEPAAGSPEAIREAQASGRVFGNAPAGPLPPGQFGRPRQSPYGGVVRPYGPQFAPRPSAGFPGGPGGEGPPSLDLEPWAPGGEFPATAAQLQLARVYQQGGEVPRHLYHQALRDKTAQMEGMPRDWRPGEAETNELRAMAENAHPGPNTRRRQALVEATLNDLLHGHGQMKRQVILNQMTGERSLKKVEAEAQKREQQQAQAFENQIKLKDLALENATKLADHKKDLAKKVEKKKTDRRDTDSGLAEKQKKYEDQYRKEAEAAYEHARKQAADPILHDVVESKIPENLRTPEARKKWVADMVEEAMTLHGRVSQEGQDLHDMLGSIPRGESGDFDFNRVGDNQLDAVREQLREVARHPIVGRFGVKKEKAQRLLATSDALAKKRKQAGFVGPPESLAGGEPAAPAPAAPAPAPPAPPAAPPNDALEQFGADFQRRLRGGR